MAKTESTTKQVGVRIYPEQEAWLEAEATRQRVSVSVVVRAAIERLREVENSVAVAEERSDATTRQIAVRVYADQVEWMEQLGGPTEAVRAAIGAAMMNGSKSKSRRK